ncbi:MAG: PEP-CTERM sorting domain-containing protein [Methylacidiphilales bacterium]|nr:PEP-CTERM sorting domain-containing protein [Candidatus Methylacidiphilales bacterium]
MRKMWILSVLTGLICAAQLNGQIIFSENMGTPTGTTSISANVFQNSSFGFSGTGDVRSTTTSGGYIGASGNGNIFLTAGSNANFVISGIDTLGYASGSLDLSFGAYKSAIASSMSELVLEYSNNGGSYVSLALPAQATGAGTANWRLIDLIDTALPVTSNLSLRWTNTAALGGVQFRLDDVMLSGTSAVPEPSSFALLFLGLGGLCFLRGRVLKCYQVKI